MSHQSGYDLDDPKFWSVDELDRELRRVGQICNGCRLCHNLCPSFPALFNRIDELDPDRADAEGALLREGAPMEEEEAAHALSGVAVSTENPVDRLSAADLGRVVDLCFNCKLCFPICPYVPPHEFAVDFPRLMLRAKAVKAKEHGVTLQDKFLGAPDLIGPVMTKIPGLANWASHNAWNRKLMELTVGIHRDRNLPEWATETFDAWWEKRQDARGEGPDHPVTETSDRPKAVLFSTCYGNYNDPEVPEAAVEVLERNGVTLAAPPLGCCGMPSLDGGDIPRCLDQARENVARLLPYVRAGYAVVTANPTCTFMLRQEYPELLKTDDARAIGSAVRDLGEFLSGLGRQGKLDRGLSGQGPVKVAYHFPCHLKVQKIGLRSRELLALIPGVEVEVVDRCCGMDGTWGMKKEFYELSLGVAKKATQQVEELAEELRAGDEPRPALVVVSDCQLAGLQLEKTTGREVKHPIVMLRDAYRAADAAKGAANAQSQGGK
ncbi:MAG: heterodisulfide reductase-related iron-sulfur binding cluster [Deltaproteobacteria bacterium]